MKKIKEQINIRNIIALIIAGVINAFGISLFLLPAGLYDSGISGTSIFFSILFGREWLLPLALIILNIPLFLFGSRKQGVQFTCYSIFIVLIYSVSTLVITEGIFQGNVSESPFAGNDMVLCALFGGLISGIGSGLAIRNGGALDFIVEGLDHEKHAMIVTERSDEINKVLTTQFGSGCTIIDAIGGYSGKLKKVIYFIVNRFQVNHMKSIVQRIDRKAYIAISEVADIYSFKDNSADDNKNTFT